MTLSGKGMLAAPCGIYCAECKVYKSKDSPAVQEALVARGLKRESVPCPGCREVKGNCPAVGKTCETYTCSVGKKVSFCFECPGFPCSKLNPAVDRANILPHNMKVFNLCFIKEKGLQKWLEEAPEIQNKYFQGKMVIGRGPVC